MRPPPSSAACSGPAHGFRGDRSGVTALEYGIVAAFLCLTLLGIFSSFGVAVTAMFSRASSAL